MDATRSPQLNANYFDGVSARAHPVTLELDKDALNISGEGVNRVVTLGDVQWPERTRHGMRVAHFRTGGSVQCANPVAWDEWCAASGQREPLVVRMQQSWRWVVASMVMLLVLGVALQRWGLPVASRALVAVTPSTVDASLGEASLALVDEHLMRPSELPAAEQARLRAALEQAVSAMPSGAFPAWRLEFRQSRMGPNALALPGGTLIMTDELVELVGRDEKVITAVLAHELGHVKHRHGVRAIVQVTILSALSAVVLGDFSTLLASVPVLLGQASYSRDAEHEADVEAVRVLRAANISPDVMVALFDKLEEQRIKEDPERKKAGQQEGKHNDKAENDGPPKSPGASDSWLGMAFASHPPDAERVRFFREAAAAR
ncbi:MAG TPA: M48 family metallopeptidase [Polaromonas sp.]|uniref:M48 family metallopeptidase n=1 Tax=Polaromonas sp. TaxID=1869339 RepID=UPI002D3FBC7E|nr:M48 family metallopeptidase [Polaromonas sp.]HYW58776.1 M48 family metallopeptidase [Polaromonas sp.]